MGRAASSSSRNRLLLAVVLSVAGHALLFVGAGFFIRPPDIPLVLGALRVAVGMRMPAAAPEAPSAPAESIREVKPETEVPAANPTPIPSPETAENPVPPAETTPAATAAGSHETAKTSPEPAVAGNDNTNRSAAGDTAGPRAVSFSTLASGAELALPSYPEAAKRWGYEGTVRIRLLVAADGELEEVELIESSGHAMLDDEVLDTVRRKWSFPPPGREVVSNKSFTFRLSSR